MANTITPSVANAKGPRFAGVAFDDPDDITAHDNLVVSAEFFLGPVQDEIKLLNSILGAKFAAVPIYNDTGGTLTKGTIVYVTGWDSTNDAWNVAKSDADDPAKPAEYFLMVDLADTTAGAAYSYGRCTGTASQNLDTSSFSEGDSVYLSSTAGEFATSGGALVGTVTVSSATVGEIDFHIVKQQSVGSVVSTNICLNPAYSVVLPGTHTSAIQQNNAASTTQNHEVPGWRSVTGTGSPDITVSRDTSQVMRTGDKASLKIVTTALGTSVNRVECPLIEGEAPAIDAMLYQSRNKTLTIAADVKQSAATASASRIGIITDGTGGTTTYSSYHGANTNVERLVASVQVPSDATYIKICIFVENATPDVNVSNWMAVSSGVALSDVPFVSRPPIEITGALGDFGLEVLSYSTPADVNYHVTGDGTADTDIDINSVRPPWANRFQGGVRVSGSAANQFFTLSVTQAATDIFQYQQVSGVTCGNNDMIMDIGTDGQISFKVSNTGLTGVANVNKWIGVGL